MEGKILQAIEGLNQRFDSMEDKFDTLDTKFDSLETRFDNLETRFDSLETRFDTLETRFDTLETRFDSLESQVKENTNILRALEHSAQVNKAEHEQMTANIAEISGQVKKYDKNITAIELVTANNWSEIVHLKAIK